MTFQEFQDAAARTREAPFPESERLAVQTLGLCGEAGELADMIKKQMWHGQPATTEKLCEELGDCLWYLADIATSIGITLDDVAAGNIAKLRVRYPNGFTPDGGIR